MVRQRVRRQRHARRGGLRLAGVGPVRGPSACRGRSRSEVAIDDSPFIEPLTGMPGDDGYGVLLINRQVARILAGGSDRMREVTSIVDDVHRWHDQGGWSQARYQRGIVKETQDHLKHAADELFKLFKRGAVQRLIIGTPGRAARRGRAQPPQLPARADRRLDRHRRALDARRRSPSEAAEIIERDERDRERDWLDRLQSEAGRNARAVAGLRRHARGAQRAARRGAAGGRRLPRRGLCVAAGGLPLRRAGQLSHGRGAPAARRRDRVGDRAGARAVRRGRGRPPPPRPARRLGSIGAVLRY